MSLENTSNSEKMLEEFRQLQPCPGLERFDSQKTEVSFDMRYRILYNKHLKVQKVVQTASGWAN